MLGPLLALVLASEPTPFADEAPSVDLEFDLSALPDDDVTRGLAYFLTEHQTEVIRDAGLEVAEGAPLVIRIRVSRYGEGDIHSRGTIALVEAGSDVPREELTVECELCRDGDLVMKIGGEVSRLSTRALYSPSDRRGETPSEGRVEAPSESSPVSDERSVAGDELLPLTVEDGQQPRAKGAGRASRGIGPLGAVGIGALVAGAAGVASGIPLVYRHEAAVIDRDGSIKIRNLRLSGLVLASAGGTLLATGAVLLSADVIRRRKRRRVAVLPGPLGLSMKGMF